MADKTVAAAVPPDVLMGLREAFSGEIAERLPRLSQADLEVVRRDAHTLASSAWVVGEPRIATLARAVERSPVDGPVGELVALLTAYVP